MDIFVNLKRDILWKNYTVIERYQQKRDFNYGKASQKKK